jgi:hypothetical protein
MKLRTLSYAAAASAAVALTLGSVGSATAAVRPQTPPSPPWVAYKDFGEPDACNSAGYAYEQEGIITGYLCDEVQPPSWDASGLTILYVTF